MKEKQLKTIYGCVTHGGIIYSGEGFTVKNINPGGIYLITFTTPFANTPAVTATQQYMISSTSKPYVWDDFDNAGGSILDNIVIVALNYEKVKLKTGDSNGNPKPRSFTFIAIGEV